MILNTDGAGLSTVMYPLPFPSIFLPPSRKIKFIFCAEESIFFAILFFNYSSKLQSTLVTIFKETQGEFEHNKTEIQMRTLAKHLSY